MPNEPSALCKIAVLMILWAMSAGAGPGVCAEEGASPPASRPGGHTPQQSKAAWPQVQGNLDAQEGAAADAQNSQSSQSPEYLLLRNGNVLCGQVQQYENGCKVLVPGGGIFVPSHEIELRARNLEECYQRKRAAILPGDVRGRLDLALWCLRYEMLEAARVELAAAKAIDPRHPMIALVARRLALADFHPPQSAKPSAETARGPSLDQLEQLVRSMPPGTVEKFTQVVQPILIRRCAAPGCHGAPTESRFRLLRSPTTRHPTRVATQRNLHAVMQHVDCENPAKSPLLISAIEPHGTCTNPPFLTTQAAQYQQLIDWVAAVSAGSLPDSSLQPALPQTALSGGAASPRPESVLGLPITTTGRESLWGSAASLGSPAQPPSTFPSLGSSPTAPGLESAGWQWELRRVAGRTAENSAPANWRGNANAPPSGESSKSTDPFDPEIFNRRYRAANSPGHGSPAVSADRNYSPFGSAVFSGSNTSPDRTAARN